MDDREIEQVIQEFAGLLRADGEADLADERHYLATTSSGERRLLPPRERLIAMLEAFDRFLKVQDTGLYSDSISLLNQNVAGEGPRGAYVEPTEGTLDERPIALAEAPDLSSVRSAVDHLIGALMEDDGSPSEPGP